MGPRIAPIIPNRRGSVPHRLRGRYDARRDWLGTTDMPRTFRWLYHLFSREPANQEPGSERPYVIGLRTEPRAARIMAAKGGKTMRKGAEMALKLAQNRVSFGLNGSHKARKPLQAKGPVFCPPADTSKHSTRKEFRPIVTAHRCQHGSKVLRDKGLWKWTFPTFPVARI